MKSLILILTAICLGQTASAFHGGQYAGKATWKDNSGNTGAYEKTMVISDGRIISEYQYEGFNNLYQFEAKLDNLGFFSVVIDGKTLGQGYCQEFQCHYSFETDGFEMEETFTFWEGHLYIVGSKTVGKKIVTWQEILEVHE